mmetsp:Transcript_13143/g.14492  ORF Transcript_13143/g.14492 Transcript_13143/m.14492 type:complete len:210 (-) Transcript_13143:332-961(-)
MVESKPAHDYVLKLILVGDSAVGKSSILFRFTNDDYTEGIQPTIGVDFKIKWMNVREKVLKVAVWDTAGQERFRTLTSAYYRGAQGICFIFDVTDHNTFESVEHWLNEFNMYCTEKDAIKLLVGNKVDKEGRQVEKSEAEVFARKHGMMYIETSAKTKVGVDQTFEEMINKVMDNPMLLKSCQSGKKTLEESKRNPSSEGGFRSRCCQS